MSSYHHSVDTHQHMYLTTPLKLKMLTWQSKHVTPRLCTPVLHENLTV
jgi:hypothetical protein